MKKVAVLFLVILIRQLSWAQSINLSDSLIKQLAIRSSNIYKITEIHAQKSLKQDNNSCSYFTIKNKAILQKVILDQLAEFKCKTKDCRNVFIRHWKFISVDEALTIETEANKYYDGEGMPIKEPHIVIRAKNEVYIIYVLAESDRSQLEYFKKIVKTNP